MMTNNIIMDALMSAPLSSRSLSESDAPLTEKWIPDDLVGSCFSMPDATPRSLAVDPALF